MITLKTPEEIAVIHEGGRLLANLLDVVLATAKPGVTTRELDTLSEKMIRETGGVPAFKGYRDHASEPPFPSTICVSVNEQLVHTPASDYALREGDILTVDIGMRYPGTGKGYFTDMARTISIGAPSAETKKLLDVTSKSLDLGIAAAVVGNSVSDISAAVQNYVEPHGFSIVRSLVGHGVGYAVHEEPRVPNFVDRRLPDVKLKVGMVLAIEPMVNVGGYEIDTLDDGWTIVTADGSMCAHFEDTIAVTENGPVILTRA